MLAETAAFRTEHLPPLHKSLSQRSQEAQKQFLRATRVGLAFGVLAAVAGVLTLKGEDGPDWAGVIALIAFLGALWSRFWLTQNAPERKWYDARAGAESVKTLAWQYAVGGGAYRLGCPEEASTPEERLLGPLRDVLHETASVTPTPLVGEEVTDAQITERMRQLREQPLEDRQTVYSRDRLDDQIKWYSTNAQKNTKQASFWNSTTMALQALGVLAALAKAIGLLEIDVLGIAATAATAAPAWLQTKDHVELAEAYSVAAHDLLLVKAELENVNAEEDWASFVADSEGAISREHTLWRARKRRRAR